MIVINIPGLRVFFEINLTCRLNSDVQPDWKLNIMFQILIKIWLPTTGLTSNNNT